MKSTRVLCHRRAFGRAAICIVLTSPGVYAQQAEAQPGDPTVPPNEPALEPSEAAPTLDHPDERTVESDAQTAPQTAPESRSAPAPQPSSPTPVELEARAPSDSLQPQAPMPHPLAETPVESFRTREWSNREPEGRGSDLGFRCARGD